MDEKKFVTDIPFVSWSEQKRIQALKSSLGLLLDFAGKYEASLDLEISQKNTTLNKGFLYFDQSYRYIIELVSYVVIVEGRGKKFTHHMVRAALEGSMRLEHYLKQTKEEQDKISSIEIARALKLMQSDNLGGTSFAEWMENLELSPEEYTQQRSKKVFDSFPDMRTLMNSSSIKERTDLDWYFHYEYLCELTHGKLVGIISLDHLDNAPIVFYRRNLMYLHSILKHTLLLADKHNNFANSDELEKVIQLSDRKAFYNDNDLPNDN